MRCELLAPPNKEILTKQKNGYWSAGDWTAVIGTLGLILSSVAVLSTTFPRYVISGPKPMS